MPGLLSEIVKICRFPLASTPFHLFSYTLARTIRHRLRRFEAPFCIGFPKDMRDFKAFRADLIGFFVNTIPIPFRFCSADGEDEKPMPLNEALSEMASIFEAAMNTENACIPYNDLLELAKIDSLFDVMLVMHNTPDAGVFTWEGGRKSFEIFKSPVRFTKFPLTIFVRQNNDSDLTVDVEYLEALLSRESVKALIDRWIGLLRTIVKRISAGDEVLTSDLLKDDSFDIIEDNLQGLRMDECKIWSENEERMGHNYCCNGEENSRQCEAAPYDDRHRIRTTTESAQRGSSNYPNPNMASFFKKKGCPLSKFEGGKSCIVQCLLEQSLKSAESIAIQTPVYSITYGALILIINSFARQIRARYLESTGASLSADTPVAVFGHRNSVTFILLSLAIICAGGAYVPIDEENCPRKRVEEMLEEAQVNFALADHPHQNQCERYGRPINFDAIFKYRQIIERFIRYTEQSSADALQRPLFEWASTSRPTDLAYIIFTSGTSGCPKGVAIERSGILNMVADASQQFEVGPSDCVYQFTNFAFDNSVLEVLLIFFYILK